MITIKDAHDTLERHRRFAETVRNTLKGQSSNTNETLDSLYLNRIISEINEETRNFTQLELRITIVASMKSGKSTIINALIGENILPTRANAMTIIPTEIIFKREVKESILFLSNEAIHDLGVISDNIRRCLLLADVDETKKLDWFDHQSHLVTLVHQMTNPDYRFMLENQIVGPNKIQNALLLINDLIRLYLILVDKQAIEIKDLNLQALQKQIPRIETPFSDIINIFHEGNLVIVDTPGPNEAQMCKQLEEIVTRELRKAGVILIVFNFMTLNTQADAKIMKEIAELRNLHGSSDCLYAIVNKVDQRRKGDMSKDDVKKFISTKYGIEEMSTTDVYARRFFETRAIFGLIAKRFLDAYERLKEKNIEIRKEDMQIIDELGYELYNLDWETDRDTIALEQLYKGAVNMWNMSGLNELIHIVVGGLMIQVSSRIVESTLAKCKRVDRELIEYLTQRQIAMKTSQDKLIEKKMELEKEMYVIKQTTSHKHIHLEPFLKSLRDDLEEISATCLDEIDQFISKWPSSDDGKFAPLNKKFLEGMLVGGIPTATYFTVSLGAAVAVGVPLVAAAGAYHMYSKNMVYGKRISIENESENEDFRDGVDSLVSQVCHIILMQINKRINIRCQRLSEDLYASVIITTSDILKHIQTILNVPITMQPPTIEPLTIQIDELPQKTIRLEEKKKIGFFKKDKYYINRDAFRYQCNQFTAENLNSIKGRIEHWFWNTLEATYSNYLSELEGYVTRYRNYIKSLLDIANSNEDDRNEYLRNLQHLIDQLNIELQKLTVT